MANHDSAKKAYRQTLKKTEVNRSRMSRIRTFVKKVESALASGVKEEAMTALSVAQSEIMKGVKKGLIKLNAGARKVSRLSAKIKKAFAA
jgi:small subunit ribosomal protein S20